MFWLRDTHTHTHSVSSLRATSFAFVCIILSFPHLYEHSLWLNSMQEIESGKCGRNRVSPIYLCWTGLFSTPPGALSEILC